MSVQVQHRRDVTSVIAGITPAVAELGYDTQKKTVLIGDGATAGGVYIEKKNLREIVTPAQLVANTNNYSPTGLNHAGVLRVSTDASRNLTGLVPLVAGDTTDGREIEIYNAGSNNLVVRDQNASSSAANRFDLGGSDITLSSKQTLLLRYSLALTRWELYGGNYGQSIADSAVSARKLATSAVGARVGMVNGTIVESHAGNAATFALKTLAGTDPSPTDPVYFTFQNGAGGFVVRTVTAALSLVISSGSSLGTFNGIPYRDWILAFDNAGTVVLGAVNCRNGLSILALEEWRPYSTTAEGGAGAADSPQVIYTASALTSKYFCLVGFADYDSGQVAAGAWALSPTRLCLFGPGVPRPGMETGARAHAVKTDTSSIASSVLTDVSGLSVTVPVSSPQNLVDVNYNVGVGQDAAAANVSIALLRGSTSVRAGDVAGSRLSSAGASAVPYGGGMEICCGRLLDFPAAAGSTTYKIQFRIDAGNGYINRSSTDANTATGVRTASDITAFEIMG